MGHRASRPQRPHNPQGKATIRALVVTLGIALLAGSACEYKNYEQVDASTHPDVSVQRTPENIFTPTTAATSDEIHDPVRVLLERLEINDSPEPGTPYRRTDWPTWLDPDGNGCDARGDTLAKDSLVAVEQGPGCEIVSGSWISPYDGTTGASPADFDIDHVVPLAEAHRSGGWRWEAHIRAAFANDPDVLLATSASSNRSKSDKRPDQWRPQMRDYWCTYAATWVSIKLKYKLTVTTSERDALGEMLETCRSAESISAISNTSSTTTTTGPPPETTTSPVAPAPVQTTPPPTSQPVPQPATPPASAPTPAPQPSPPPTPTPPAATYYKNCTEARAAGVTPIYRGQPGYGSHLDRDNDGIACE